MTDEETGFLDLTTQKSNNSIVVVASSAPHCRSLSDYDYTSIVVVGGPQG
jgi:hypothetical protein